MAYPNSIFLCCLWPKLIIIKIIKLQSKLEEEKTMIELNVFKKLMEENDDRLPLLTLDEFFEGNMEEDSIAPNDCDFGRPSIAEIWELMREIEKRPDVAWIRIELHNDTEITEYDGKEVLVLAGESPIICTSLSAPELETLARCKWLCSGGAEEWEAYEMDSLFSCRPPVPDGFHCFAIVWD